MLLLEINGEELFFGAISMAISCWILYVIIKAAVKNGIIAARKEISSEKNNSIPGAASNWTPAQNELRRKYESGEITLEQYMKEWDV